MAERTFSRNSGTGYFQSLRTHKAAVFQAFLKSQIHTQEHLIQCYTDVVYWLLPDFSPFVNVHFPGTALETSEQRCPRVGWSDGRTGGNIFGMRRRAVGVKSCRAWTLGERGVLEGVRKS